MSGEAPAFDMLRKLPKVDLHLHLDGSVKPETIMRLSREHKISIPADDVRQLASYMKVDGICRDLTEYLQKFDFVLRYLQTEDALELIATEIVEQAAEHNCKYIEVRFAPQLHRQRGLSVEQVIASVLEGLAQGERRFGVKSRGIAICMRHHDERTNMGVVRAAGAYLGQGIVAVDLAGDEAHYPPAPFAPLFREAHRLGIPVTIHAGEAAGPQNVLAAVTELGASRIGHGVRLQEDASVLQLVLERGIPLEMCPTSNIQTRAIDGWAAYPLRRYMEAGLRVTVNTDNLTVSNTNITQEYEQLVRHLGLTVKEIRAMILTAAQSSFLPDEEKDELTRSLREQFAQLGI